MRLPIALLAKVKILKFSLSRFGPTVDQQQTTKGDKSQNVDQQQTTEVTKSPDVDWQQTTAVAKAWSLRVETVSRSYRYNIEVKLGMVTKYFEKCLNVEFNHFGVV
jgi:hypothetical protein